MNTAYLWIMVIGIVLVKAYWITTEIRLFKSRLNVTTVKTNLVEAAILAAQVIQVLYFPLPYTPADFLLLYIGLAMYIIGMIFAVWARLTMNRVWGIPGEHADQQNELVTSGPFAISRNPIYLGFILIYFGFAIAIQTWLIILRIPLLLYFYKSAKAEEKLLEKRFGQKYLKYKSSVPLIF